MSMKKPVSKDKRWRRLQLGRKFFVESAFRKNQAALNNSSTEAKAPGFPSSTPSRRDVVAGNNGRVGVSGSS
jgi:hypothetical protein